MAAPLYLTKGELRAKLLTRLGYGGIGAAAGKFVPMADELLEEAQAILFQIFTDEKGVREWEFNTGIKQRWYDIPDTCDIDRILGIYAQQNGDFWRPLKRGIDASHDSDYDDIEDCPYRYDIRARQFNAGKDVIVNGDFSSATGWFWLSTDWQVSGGKATCLSAGTISSIVLLQAGVQYEVTYTIETSPCFFVSVGGSLTDIYGTTLPVSVGTHTVQVVAASSTYAIQVYANAAGPQLDNISIKPTLSDSVKTQIEFWPKPDAVYPVKIEGPMVVSPFVADGDRASFDTHLILLYAVAYGKAHLNKPDAKASMDAWTAFLSKHKGNQHGTRKYVRRNHNTPERVVQARPKVV